MAEVRDRRAVGGRLVRRSIVVALVSVCGAALPVPTASAQPPSNDDIDSATVIPALPFTETLDITSATKATDDPFTFHGSAERSVWYAFTPAADMRVQASTCDSDFSTVLGVFTGARGALVQVASSSDAKRCPVIGRSHVLFDAVAGERYYVLAGASWFDPDAGTLVLDVDPAAPPPANDTILDATPIATLPFTEQLDTTGATRAGDDPHCFGIGGPTVWYRLTVDVPTGVFIETSSSDYPTVVSVYSGEPGALVSLGCDDNQVRTNFDAVPGTTYFVLVEAFFAAGEAGGTLQLDVTGHELPPPPANDDVATATNVRGLPFRATVDLTGADDDPGGVDGCGGGRHTVWYRYTARRNETLEVNAFGSEAFTSLTVFTGAPGALSLVGCDSHQFHFEPRVVFDAVDGQTYFIRAGSAFFSAGGQLVFELRRAVSFDFELSGKQQINARTGTTKRFDVTVAVRSHNIDDREIAILGWDMGLRCANCRIVGFEDIHASSSQLTTGPGNEGFASLAHEVALVGPDEHDVLTLAVETAVPPRGHCTTASIFFADDLFIPEFGPFFTVVNLYSWYDEQYVPGTTALDVEVCAP